MYGSLWVIACSGVLELTPRNECYRIFYLTMYGKNWNPTRTRGTLNQVNRLNRLQVTAVSKQYA